MTQPSPGKNGTVDDGTIDDRQADAVFEVADSGFADIELDELHAQLFDDNENDDPVTAGGGPDDSPTEAVEPVDDPDDGEEAGTPEAPQPCQYGEDHPAVRSLLYADDDGQAYVPVCEEHDQKARDDMDTEGDKILGVVEIDPEMAPSPVTAATAAPLPVEVAPQETGMPDAPQPCWSTDAGEHPAVRSLLYGGGAEYLPVCAEHDQDGRDLIEAEDETISREVEIREPDRLDAEEQEETS